MLHPLTLTNAENDLLHWSIGHPYIPVMEVPGHVGVWAIIVSTIVGAVGILFGRRKKSEGAPWPQRDGLTLLALLAVAAPVGAALEYLVGPSVFSSRNIISSWPATALLAGVLVTAGASPWRIAATTLLLAGIAIGGMKTLNLNNQRPDYAGAVRYIDDTGPPGAPVVDTLGLTPGAQTAMEVAFAPKGRAYPSGRQVLTLAFPTLQERLRVRMLGKSIIDPEPIPGDGLIARKPSRRPVRPATSS